MNPEDTNYFAIEYTVTPYTINRAGTRWQEVVPDFNPIEEAEYTYSDYQEEESKKEYEEGREAAREEAIDWQSNEATKPMSMDELADWQGYFHDLGSRYGLLEEFQENGIC